MGLAENIKKWKAKGRDPKEIIEKIQRDGGRLDYAPVKYNSNVRRKMSRHPEGYTLGEMSEVFGRSEAETLYRRAGYDPAQYSEEEEEDEEEEEEDEDDEDEDWEDEESEEDDKERDEE
jgi:hypothetical protein